MSHTKIIPNTRKPINKRTIAPITACSKEVRGMLGLSLHSWENGMVLSLIVAGFFALVAGAATWAVVRLTRLELAESKKELDAYKLAVEFNVADARKEGIEAGKTAGNALLRAAESEKRAAESNERAVKLELELAKIKQPRLLSEERLRPLAERLKRFAPTPFDLAFIPGDPEAAIFGTHIAAMLEMAGWKWVAWAPEGAAFQQVFTITGTDKPNIGQVGFFDVGIFLRPDDPDTLASPVQALVELLQGEGFAAAFETSTNPNINNKATVHITVGKKR
jgi:hypothetical protein